MQIHHRIIHHFHKHKARVIEHVNKHQKKYIAGAGVLSGMAIFKLTGIIVLFLATSRLGGILGADYYDTEYYAGLSGISINTITQTPPTTGCILTGENILSGTTGNCPIVPNK